MVINDLVKADDRIATFVFGCDDVTVLLTMLLSDVCSHVVPNLIRVLSEFHQYSVRRTLVKPAITAHHYSQ